MHQRTTFSFFKHASITGLLPLAVLMLVMPLTLLAQYRSGRFTLFPLPVQQSGSSSMPLPSPTSPGSTGGTHHYEYVFPDGTIYVYDMDNGHRLVKQISVPTTTGVRGVVASATTHTLYISYGRDGNSGGSMLAYDLLTDTVMWTKTYTHGIDSMSITPDGKTIYMPDGEVSSAPYWYIINAADGSEAGTKIDGGPNPHNTVVSLNGTHVYMGARNLANTPTYLTVANTATNQIIKTVGPFQSGVRPFTINRNETFVYTSVTGLLGFQVGDLTKGTVLSTVDLTTLGFPNTPSGPTDPSHGVALSPDNKTLAVVDWPNDYVHLFDVSGSAINPPQKDCGY